MKVVHFHRARGLGVSIERLFEHIRCDLPDDMEVEICTMPFDGTNPLKMLYNIVWAMFHQGDVNHITGDCHYIALGLNRRKTVITIHDCVKIHSLKGLKLLIYRWLWFILPSKCVTRIIAISEKSKNELLELIEDASSKVSVINNCFDPCFNKQPLPDSLGKPRILQVGTGKNKNLSGVIKALLGINCHFRIIGKLTREQIEALEKYQIDYSAVSNISDSELLAEYIQCSIVTFVSTYEGFGLPVIEAQAIGRPVVTSNIEPMLSVAGDGAVLVDPLNPEEIRAAINLVLLDKKIQISLRNKGFKNTQRFLSAAIAQQYALVYRQLLEQ